MPVMAVAFEDVPRGSWLTSLSDADVLRQAHVVTPEGIEYHGGAAATAALRLTRLAVIGRILDLPGVRFVRDAGYTLTVRSRGVLSRVFDG